MSDFVPCDYNRCNREGKVRGTTSNGTPVVVCYAHAMQKDFVRDEVEKQKQEKRP